MPAKGTAEWQGDLKSGTGTFVAGDDLAETRAALDGWVSRIGEELHAQSVAYSQG